MPRFERSIKRAGQKAKLKQLERHSAQEYKRGFEMGGQVMKKAIEQAKGELAVTKLDGE